MRKPELAARMVALGLAYAFMDDDDQNALMVRFREGAKATSDDWMDFPSITDAAPWVEAQLAEMPPLAIVVPGGDFDDQPALVTNPSSVLAHVMRGPTRMGINGCLLLAADGSAGLEIFVNHTADGDVVSVQSWLSPSRSQTLG